MVKMNPQDYMVDDIYELGLTEEDIEKINKPPEEVTDVALEQHFSPDFPESFKKVIDTHTGESTQMIVDKLIKCVNINPYPINPNNHEFATVSEKDIIKYRLGKVVEEKFVY
jgi:hypothetical protein